MASRSIELEAETDPGDTGRPPIIKAASRLIDSPLFCYLSILAIQLRVVWEFWAGRDLSSGDTSGYFTVAQLWAGSLKNVFFWSPLYTAYYGTVLKVTGDPVVATLVHRMIVVFAVTALVLAVTRRLLPAAAAWLVSAWWAVQPLNYDTFYEVHLFALLPILIGVLLLARRPTHGARAAVLAIFAASTVLVRNEMIFATVAFGLACLWALAGEVRRSGGVRALGHLLKPYLAGAVAATLAVAFFYSRSTIRYPEIAQIFQQRATTNFCQAFAFSYQQRNPEWAGNPFVDCGELMAPTFGPAEEAGLSNPGFTEALRRNPGAVLDYLRWNARLVPNGIQLALFGGTSRPENPDYVPMPVGQTMPWLLSIACLLVLLGGAWAYQNDSRLWKEWIRNRRWPLLALACPALGVVIVMIQQRPRPSYMFAFTLLLMALLGFSAFALLRALDATDVLKLAVPLVAAALLVAAPARYSKSATPLKDSFVRLEPYAEKLGNTAAAVPGYGPDLCRYLSVGRCRINDYWANVRPLAEAAGSLDAALNRMEVGLFYADTAVLSDPVAAEVVDGANPRWEKSDGKNGEWALFERVEGPAR